MTVHAFDGPGIVDEPDESPSRPTSVEDSPWKSLEQAMRRPLPKEVREVSPLRRSDVRVRLRTNVSLDEVTEWRKGAKDETFPGGFNPLRLVCILLANASTDILIGGTSTGETLASPRIAQMYPDAFDEVDAVRHFFGCEDLWLTGRVLPSLMSAWSGGDDDTEPVRPTAAGL